MLWLALHLPQLSLEAFCHTLTVADAARPVALADQHHVSAVNAAAARCGVQPGFKRATALALAAELLIGQASAARDAAALQALAHAALAFTPMVALRARPAGQPAVVLLEVQASLRYFGGLQALLTRLRQALAPLGHRLQIASAPSAAGAALLALWRDGFEHGRHSTDRAALQRVLGDAPLGLLGLGREQQALQDMGLQTLAELRCLPRSGLARRFGEELLAELDAAFGVRAEVHQALLLPPVFDSRLELFARADTSAQLLHGALVLLLRLVAWARALQARVVAFTLLMQHERRHRGETTAESSRLRIELAEPSLDAEHLQLLLRERLARLELPAPTLELRLSCEDIVHSAAPNGELFPTRHSQAQGLTRLLERLRARLGDEQVLRIVPLADHRPERACGLQPVSAPAVVSAPASGVAPRAKPATATTLPSAPHQLSHQLPDQLPRHRPVWLLPEPLPLASRHQQPLLAGRPLQLVSGPERIESGWWDGALVTRDYFIAQDADGALCWIFCDRLSSAAAGWFLQGRFG